MPPFRGAFEAKLFVPLTLAASALFFSAHAAMNTGQQVEPGVFQIGTIKSRAITESSGLVASHQFPGVFWTHNDGSKKKSLYAIDRQGNTLAEFKLSNITLEDWEDLASFGEQHLLIADIGNNNAKPREIAVHEVAEPNPKSSAGAVTVQRSWHLRYPAKPFDAESLFAWQTFGYLVSKVTDDRQAEIYRFALTNQNGPAVLEFVTKLKIDSPVAAATLSSDGRRLGLVAKSGAFVYRIDGDVAKAGLLKPSRTKFQHKSIEGCSFVPEGLLATAESREIFLFTDPPFRPRRE